MDTDKRFVKKSNYSLSTAKKSNNNHRNQTNGKSNSKVISDKDDKSSFQCNISDRNLTVFQPNEIEEDLKFIFEFNNTSMSKLSRSIALLDELKKELILQKSNERILFKKSNVNISPEEINQKLRDELVDILIKLKESEVKIQTIFKKKKFGRNQIKIKENFLDSEFKNDEIIDFSGKSNSKLKNQNFRIGHHAKTLTAIPNYNESNLSLSKGFSFTSFINSPKQNHFFGSTSGSAFKNFNGSDTKIKEYEETISGLQSHIQILENKIRKTQLKNDVLKINNNDLITKVKNQESNNKNDYSLNNLEIHRLYNYNNLEWVLVKNLGTKNYEWIKLNPSDENKPDLNEIIKLHELEINANKFKEENDKLQNEINQIKNFECSDHNIIQVNDKNNFSIIENINDEVKEIIKENNENITIIKELSENLKINNDIAIELGNEDSNNLIDQIKVDIRENNGIMRKLKSTINNLEIKINTLEGTNIELTTKLSDTELIKNDLNQKLINLQVVYDDLSKNLIEQKKLNNDQTEKLLENTLTIENTDKNLEKLQIINNEFSLKLSSQQMVHNELSNKLNEICQINTENNKNLSDQMKTIDNLKNNLDDQNIKIESLNNQLSDLENILNDLKIKYSDLEKNNISLNQKLIEAENFNITLNKQLNILENVTKEEKFKFANLQENISNKDNNFLTLIENLKVIVSSKFKGFTNENNVCDIMNKLEFNQDFVNIFKIFDMLGNLLNIHNQKINEFKTLNDNLNLDEVISKIKEKKNSIQNNLNDEKIKVQLNFDHLTGIFKTKQKKFKELLTLHTNYSKNTCQELQNILKTINDDNNKDMILKINEIINNSEKVFHENINTINIALNDNDENENNLFEIELSEIISEIGAIKKEYENRISVLNQKNENLQNQIELVQNEISKIENLRQTRLDKNQLEIVKLNESIFQIQKKLNEKESDFEKRLTLLNLEKENLTKKQNLEKIEFENRKIELEKELLQSKNLIAILQDNYENLKRQSKVSEEEEEEQLTQKENKIEELTLPTKNENNFMIEIHSCKINNTNNDKDNFTFNSRKKSSQESEKDLIVINKMNEFSFEHDENASQSRRKSNFENNNTLNLSRRSKFKNDENEDYKNIMITVETEDQDYELYKRKSFVEVNSLKNKNQTLKKINDEYMKKIELLEKKNLEFISIFNTLCQGNKGRKSQDYEKNDLSEFAEGNQNNFGLEAEEITRKILELEEIISRYKSNNEILSQLNDSNESKVRSLNYKILLLNNTNKQIALENQDLANFTDSLKDKISELENEIKLKKEDLDQIQFQLHEKIEIEKSLNSMIDSLILDNEINRKFDNHQGNKFLKDQKHSELKNMILELQDKNKFFNEIQDTLREQIRVKADENERLQNELSRINLEYKSRFQDLNSEINLYKKQLKDKTDEIINLNKTFEEFKQTKSDTFKIKKYEEKIKELTSENETLNMKLLKEITSVKQLEHQISANTKTINEIRMFNNNIIEYQNKIKMLQNENNELKSINEDFFRKIASNKSNKNSITELKDIQFISNFGNMNDSNFFDMSNIERIDINPNFRESWNEKDKEIKSLKEKLDESHEFIINLKNKINSLEEQLKRTLEARISLNESFEYQNKTLTREINFERIEKFTSSLIKYFQEKNQGGDFNIILKEYAEIFGKEMKLSGEI